MGEELRYEALAGELAGLIEDGTFRSGQRLPSIRQLSKGHRLSISTVQQALRVLEARQLVEARPQSGYYVRGALGERAQPLQRDTPVAPMPVHLSERLAGILAAGSAPGGAPFMAAWPAPALLPVEALQRLYAGVARRHPRLLAAARHLDMNEPALVRELVRRSLDWGGGVSGEEIVVTNSCTEALALCLRAVTRPGDTVAVESPAYYLMLQLLETLGLKALEIPTDPLTGLSLEALELATRQGGVQACLLVPNASNPLGSVMPDEHKQKLAALTAARNIPVIEDDIYGDLYFGTRRPWPIKAFDRTGNVLMCSSFSKSLSPSLRVGYVAAGRYSAAIALQKTVTSGATNPVSQIVLAEYLASGAFERGLRGLRRAFATQVQCMRAAVARYFPTATRIAQPQGGLVLWVELPEGIDTLARHAEAIAAGAGYVPGELFSASGMYRNCLRLSCGHPHTAETEAALQRLGGIFSAA